MQTERARLSHKKSRWFRTQRPIDDATNFTKNPAPPDTVLCDSPKDTKKTQDVTPGRMNQSNQHQQEQGVEWDR